MQSCQNEPPVEDELGRRLRQYRIPYPDEAGIDRTVDVLRAYVPRGKRAQRTGRMRRLLREAAICMDFTGFFFWAATAALYALGLILTLNTPVGAYQTVLFLAPTPFLLSLLDVFRGREEGVRELELSCRITPQELAVARILVAGGYNVVLNLGLSLALLFLKPAVIFWQITLFWLVPMLLTGGAALLLCSRFRSVYAVPLTLCAWFVCASLIAVLSQTVQFPAELSRWLRVFLLPAGIALFAAGMSSLKKQYGMECETSAWN